MTSAAHSLAAGVAPEREALAGQSEPEAIAAALMEALQRAPVT